MDSDESPFPLEAPATTSLKRNVGTILYIERGNELDMNYVNCLALVDESISRAKLVDALFAYTWVNLYSQDLRQFLVGSVRNFLALDYEHAKTFPAMGFHNISEADLEKRIHKFGTASRKPMVIHFEIDPTSEDFDLDSLHEYKQQVDAYFSEA